MNFSSPYKIINEERMILEKSDRQKNEVERGRQALTGGSVTNIEALRHSMYSLLSSVSIFVNWNKNSATGWGGAFICRTIGVLALSSWV